VAASIVPILLGVALLLTGWSLVVGGQAPHLPVAPFQNLNALTRIKGTIVCAGCTLDEVQRARAASGSLYEVHSARGAAVLRVDDVDDAARWASITQGRRLTVRAAAPVLQALTAEENRFKELEITGLLRSDRTFDVAQVSVLG
jgi:hypothetical protein